VTYPTVSNAVLSIVRREACRYNSFLRQQFCGHTERMFTFRQFGARFTGVRVAGLRSGSADGGLNGHRTRNAHPANRSPLYINNINNIPLHTSPALPMVRISSTAYHLKPATCDIRVPIVTSDLGFGIFDLGSKGQRQGQRYILCFTDH